VTTRDAPIHASGHGYQEEIKLMLNLTRPRFVMPFHGDHKRIHLHAQLAEAVGIGADNIFKGENGLPLELDARGARWGSKVQSGMIFVDGVDIGDVTDVALRDRRMLSADGIFVVVATISEQDGSSVAEPEVIFRGVPFADEADKLLDELRNTVEASIARAAGEEIREIDLLQEILHDDLAAFVYDRLKRRPMVLPVVVEV
jgi:ribonuclease J